MVALIVREGLAGGGLAGISGLDVIPGGWIWGARFSDSSSLGRIGSDRIAESALGLRSGSGLKSGSWGFWVFGSGKYPVILGGVFKRRRSWAGSFLPARSSGGLVGWPVIWFLLSSY